MKTFIAFLLTVLLYDLPLCNRPAFALEQKWQQGVRYQIEAELDTTAKRLQGYMRIFYQNNSPDTLTKIYLQVPSNAYHDEENTAMKEMRRFSGGNIDFDQTRGYKLTIRSLQFLSIGRQKIFPLQAYDFSDTILNLTLPYALQPGDTLSLGLSFRQDFARTGRDSQKVKLPTNFVLWFPRLAVYDEHGWQAEPFHFMMEASDIYSDFAEMEVTLTVPGNYIVVGAGEVVAGDAGWQAVRIDTSMDKETYQAWSDSLKQELKQFGLQNGPKQVRFHAKKQQNFVWSASPDFVFYPHRYHDTPIHIFYRGGNPQHWLKAMLKNLDETFKYLESHFAPLASQLNVVKAGNRSFVMPGMALIFDDEPFSLAYELTGMYFPGLVASNGVKESWLAKGIQVYMGKSFSEKTYGARGYDMDDAQEDMNWFERQYPLPSFDAVLRNFTRLYMESGQNEPISNSIHKYKDPLSALSNIYLKSEIFYEMLRFVVGDSAFVVSTRELVQRYAYSHISESDLQKVFEKNYGQELDWFFRQWLHDTPVVDYSKGKVKKYQRDDDKWVTEVELERKGDGIMPVEVEMDLGDGQKVVKRWDGKAKAGKVIFESEKKPKKVKVDPDDRIMDSNRLNDQGLRLEWRPDLPLLKFIHMPSDAILVLWRPLIDYNRHDSVRLGVRTSSSYRAFYHNLVLEAVVGVDSREIDGKIAYSNPLSRERLMNRYHLLLRKNEGRLEADAHLSFKGSSAILANNSRSLDVGLNYSDLLN
ncbi:MAG: M1 family aminopeptidase, partial [bacterium]